jgi:putative ABC transport system substrate-binding protein
VPVALAGSYDYDAAFATAKKGKSGAALVLFSPVFYVQRARIGAAALASRLGIVSQDRDIVEAGGLMSYGPTNEELFGRAAYFIDRLLKGAKPSDLPVEQPSTLRLAVNLKTAKALKLTIPESVMLRADEVLR